jgi:hypothetical protein
MLFYREHHASNNETELSLMLFVFLPAHDGCAWTNQAGASSVLCERATFGAKRGPFARKFRAE